MFQKTIFSLLSIFLLVGCEIPLEDLKTLSEKDATYRQSLLTAPTGGNLEASCLTLTQALQSKSCVQCHGNGVEPRMNGSSMSVCSILLGSYIFIPDPNQSVLVNYATNNHNGAMPDFTLNEIKPLVRKVVEDYQSQNQGGGNNNPPPPDDPLKNYLKSTIFEVPSNASNYTVNISLEYFDQRMTGAQLMMTFHYQSNLSAYEIKNVKVTNRSDQDVYIEDIRILQGVQASSLQYTADSQSFIDVGRVVLAGRSDVSLSNQIQLMTHSNGVFFQLAIKTLELSSLEPCADLSFFQSDVKPILQTNCVSCHNGGNSTAYSKFRMVYSDDAQLCSEVRLRVNFGTPTSSVLIKNPEGNNGHTQVGGFGSVQKNTLLDWIQREDL